VALVIPRAVRLAAALLDSLFEHLAWLLHQVASGVPNIREA